MQRSRLSERQVLGILKADETSADGGRSLPRERDLGIDIFQLEVEVWRDDGGGGVDDIEKDYGREFSCNKRAKDIFNRLRSRFSSFANFAGNFGPFGAAFAVVSFGTTLITPGATISISNTNIVGTPPYQTSINFNVTVTVSSVSTTASNSMGF